MPKKTQTLDKDFESALLNMFKKLMEIMPEKLKESRRTMSANTAYQ